MRAVTWLEVSRGDYLFPWTVSPTGYVMIEAAPSRHFDAEQSGWKGVDVEPPFLIACDQTAAREVYAPLSRDDLHRRFGSLVTAKSFRDAAQAFATRYGLLGTHGVLLDLPAGMAPPENSLPYVEGEALARWQLEARTMAAVIGWWDAARSRTYGRCSPFIRWSRRDRLHTVAVLCHPGDRFPAETLAQESCEGCSGLRPELLARWSRDQVQGTIDALRYAVYLRVNEQLRGHVSPVLAPGGGQRTYLRPDSLLAAMWTLLAFELAAAPSPERRCLDCGGPLEGGTRRRRYCNATCRRRHYDRLSRPRKEPAHAQQAPREP